MILRQWPRARGPVEVLSARADDLRVLGADVLLVDQHPDEQGVVRLRRVPRTVAGGGGRNGEEIHVAANPGCEKKQQRWKSRRKRANEKNENKKREISRK